MWPAGRQSEYSSVQATEYRATEYATFRATRTRRASVEITDAPT